MTAQTPHLGLQRGHVMPLGRQASLLLDSIMDFQQDDLQTCWWMRMFRHYCSCDLPATGNAHLSARLQGQQSSIWDPQGCLRRHQAGMCTAAPPSSIYLSEACELIV